jgi:adenosylcobyric acid synthase
MIEIVIPYLPHIANFDEFDPLLTEPGVHVRYVRWGDEMGNPDVIILPGSKTVIADLAWLHRQGLAEAIRDAHARGAQVVGICGGFQMLGQELVDLHGLEGGTGAYPGLGLLPVRTEFHRRKLTYRSLLQRPDGQLLTGYEIHTGRSELLDGAQPFGFIVRRGGRAAHAPDGAQSNDGTVWGTYLHGIFENDSFRHAWLASLGWRRSRQLAARPSRFAAYDRLADIVEASVNMDAILRIARLR